MKRSVIFAALSVTLALTGLALRPAPASAQETVFSEINDVAQLAQILGGAHYLRFSCDETQEWRDQMIRLLDLEAMDDDGRRRRLTRSFNDGYQREQERFPVCTASGREAEMRLAAQGRRLAERLGDRYLD